jgi:hypothetical protein
LLAGDQTKVDVMCDAPLRQSINTTKSIVNNYPPVGSPDLVRQAEFPGTPGALPRIRPPVLIED